MKAASCWFLVASSSLSLLGGCAQIIGIEDPELRSAPVAGSSGQGSAGSAAGVGGAGPGGQGGGPAGSPGAGSPGNAGQSGQSGAGQGGEGDAGQGGEGDAGQGGEGDAGQGGESGAGQRGGGNAGQGGQAASGGAAGAGAGGGCSGPEECPESESACQTRTCSGGVCGLAALTKGTVLAQQIPGDCRTAVCDGEGNILVENDDSDIPQTAACLLKTCSGGSLTTAAAEAGSSCDGPGGKLCDGKGSCVECLGASDCGSGLCDGGACLAAGCGDGVKNGDESDVDCGGSCGDCAPDKACKAAADCQSEVCAGGLCAAPSCSDIVKNGLEADIDCGGPDCEKCAANKACKEASDCISGVCVGDKCQAPGCLDGVKNGNEIDIDCGGSCPKCSNGQACAAPADCKSGICAGGICKATACNDGAKNGDESDVDCGGSCGGCALSKACKAAADCQSGACVGGSCQAYLVAIGGGQEYSCAAHGGGQLKCWGRNQSGSLGLGDGNHRGDQPGEMGDKLPPVDLGLNARVVSISRGLGLSTCAILEGGALKCWGANASGQLGLGDTNHRGDQPGEMGDKLPPVDLGAGHTAKAVALGTEHVCAILDDDSVRCWGNGGEGRLGLGDTSHRGDQPGEMGDKLPPVDLGPGRTAKAIAAGAMHSCAILDDDSVRCWGYGAEGQLFNGNPGFDVGDGPGEMGAALSPAPLGTGRTARAIALGYVHTCVLLDNSKVKCLGANNNGRLGFGDTASHQDLIGDNLPPVDLGLDVLSLTAGSNFTCTLLSDHSSKCWGENFDGWLGLGDTNHRGDDQGEMGAKLPVISLGNGLAPTSLFAGAFHTCALFGEEKLKCWGSNSNGTLGLGDSNHRGDQPGEMGDKLPFVSF